MIPLEGPPSPDQTVCIPSSQSIHPAKCGTCDTRQTVQSRECSPGRHQTSGYTTPALVTPTPHHSCQPRLASCTNYFISFPQPCSCLSLFLHHHLSSLDPFPPPCIEHCYIRLPVPDISVGQTCPTPSHHFSLIIPILASLTSFPDKELGSQGISRPRRQLHILPYPSVQDCPGLRFNSIFLREPTGLPGQNPEK